MSQCKGTLQVPTFFQEVLGQITTLLEMFLILLPSLGITAILVVTDAMLFREIGLLRSIAMILFIFDIIAGTIANLTNGTNDHYAASPVKRWIFLCIHVQPLIFSWLIGDYFIVCLLVWLFTMTMAFIVNTYIHHPSQRAMAGAMVVIGLSVFMLFANHLPGVLQIALIMFMLKVIYSFAVDHTWLQKKNGAL